MMNTPLDYVSQTEIGERLRLARDVANVTQAAASAAVNIARTTLVAIEKGQRRVRMDELQKLAKLYCTSVNSMLRVEAVHVDLVPRFRKITGDSEESVHSATQLLSRLAKAEVELENLLGITRVFNYPPERPILPGNVPKQAEEDAMELRQRLGLGLRPVPDITTLLELELGVRVFVRRIDSRVSGLFVYEPSIGACIMLNANHPLERRNQTAAHELGHLVSARNSAEILRQEAPGHSEEEIYSNAFGRAFLTPARPLTERLKEITAGSLHLTRRHVIVLAYIFV